MATVPEGQLVVREYRPGRVRALALGLCLLMTLVFVTGYLSGSRHFSESAEDVRAQARALERSSSQVETLQRDITNLRVALQVDMATLEQVRREMSQLQGRVVEQESELNRYRNLLKDTGGKGLLVDSMTFAPGDRPGRYTYSLVIRQKEVLMKTVDVTIDVVFEGQSRGRPVMLALADLDTKLEAGPIKTRFKYFKVLEGSLSLPAGFTPARVSVTVAPVEAGKPAAQATFEWQLPEV